MSLRKRNVDASRQVGEQLNSVGPQAGPSIIQLAVENVGTVRAGIALGHLVTWAWAAQKYGPQVTPEQYAEQWLVSRATAFRRRRLILDAFDGAAIDRLLEMVCEATSEIERRTERQAMQAAGSVVVLPAPMLSFG